LSDNFHSRTADENVGSDGPPTNIGHSNDRTLPCFSTTDTVSRARQQSGSRYPLDTADSPDLPGSKNSPWSPFGGDLKRVTVKLTTFSVLVFPTLIVAQVPWLRVGVPVFGVVLVTADWSKTSDSSGNGGPRLYDVIDHLRLGSGSHRLASVSWFGSQRV